VGSAVNKIFSSISFMNLSLKDFSEKKCNNRRHLKILYSLQSQ
jgi:hypothetical protein